MNFVCSLCDGCSYELKKILTLKAFMLQTSLKPNIEFDIPMFDNVGWWMAPRQRDTEGPLTWLVGLQLEVTKQRKGRIEWHVIRLVGRQQEAPTQRRRRVGRLLRFGRAKASHFQPAWFHCQDGITGRHDGELRDVVVAKLPHGIFFWLLKDHHGQLRPTQTKNKKKA